MDEIRIVNRNIKFDKPDERQETSSYKCEYKNRNEFKILQINIHYGAENRIYEVESKYLKPTSKSIHFNAIKVGNSFDIQWSPKEIIPYIKEIK